MTLEDILAGLEPIAAGARISYEALELSSGLLISAASSHLGDYSMQMLAVERGSSFSARAGKAIRGEYKGVPFVLVSTDLEWLARESLDAVFISYSGETGKGMHYSMFNNPYALSYSVSGKTFGAQFTPYLPRPGGDMPGAAPQMADANIINAWDRQEIEKLPGRKAIAGFVRDSMALSFRRAYQEFRRMGMAVNPPDREQYDYAAKLFELNYLLYLRG